MSTQLDFTTWMVRGGRGGYLVEEFLRDKIVAIGWNDLGEIPLDIDYNKLKAMFKEEYEDDSEGRVNQSVGQIWKFVHEFEVGDKVVTYDSSARRYYLGEVTSDYKFSDELEYFHYRDVNWHLPGIDRDLLSTDVKNEMGAFMTIFRLSKEAWDELNKISNTKLLEGEAEELERQLLNMEKVELEQLKEDVAARSQEFIKDILTNLSWQDTERVVAGLLRALGYKTRLTSSGSDLGSDIIASPDVLGLDAPQIKVEVKKRTNEKISAPEIRNFIGGLRGHHKGIFVTTSGFSKEAKYEAERANFPITLIDSDWLVELLTNYYEQLDAEIRALVPLKKIYWPV